MSELTHLIEGMADSLDESVTHEDIHRLLIEALEISMAQDAENNRKPRTIETAEELDALGIGSVIREEVAGDSAQKDEAGNWYLWGGDVALDSDDLHLPATILWEPR